MPGSLTLSRKQQLPLTQQQRSRPLLSPPSAQQRSQAHQRPEWQRAQQPRHHQAQAAKVPEAVMPTTQRRQRSLVPAPSSQAAQAQQAKTTKVQTRSAPARPQQPKAQTKTQQAAATAKAQLAKVPPAASAHGQARTQRPQQPRQPAPQRPAVASSVEQPNSSSRPSCMRSTAASCAKALDRGVQQPPASAAAVEVKGCKARRIRALLGEAVWHEPLGSLNATHHLPAARLVLMQYDIVVPTESPKALASRLLAYGADWPVSYTDVHDQGMKELQEWFHFDVTPYMPSDDDMSYLNSKQALDMELYELAVFIGQLDYLVYETAAAWSVVPWEGMPASIDPAGHEDDAARYWLSCGLMRGPRGAWSQGLVDGSLRQRPNATTPDGK
ncbi:hypothetical protein PLESTB_001345500 [Pleodorina starrii]|uniref:Uncharacterized protein n=1 Tax=Pleodorina starrii TaxID=330485 RepID=A0A9W6BUQ5_9CHLO|nr:hypothetical protein PLESTB_001345500 [Pleodorina starrii]